MKTAAERVLAAGGKYRQFGQAAFRRNALAPTGIQVGHRSFNKSISRAILSTIVEKACGKKWKENWKKLGLDNQLFGLTHDFDLIKYQFLKG